MFVQENRSHCHHEVNEVRHDVPPGIGTVIQQNRERLVELDEMASEILRLLNGDFPSDPIPEPPGSLSQEAFWQNEFIGRISKMLRLTIEALR